MAELDGGENQSHHQQKQQGQTADVEVQQIKKQALAVRRPDNQDQTRGEEQAGAVMRPDNQNQATGEGQALAVMRSDYQDQTTGEAQPYRKAENTI